MKAFGGTHPGLRREKNEDSFLCLPERGLFAVADGLGGLQYGEEASKLALDLVSAAKPKELEEACALVCDVSRRVYARGIELCGDMIGTTLTLAMLSDDFLRIIHVGDSVAFMTNPDGTGLQLTPEQTVAEEHRKAGKTNIPHYLNHVLTQCLGQEKDVLPVEVRSEFPTGARLLLCSDGITKVIDAEEILRVLAVGSDPETIVKALIDAANEGGGPDNSTAVVVFA